MTAPRSLLLTAAGIFFMPQTSGRLVRMITRTSHDAALLGRGSLLVLSVIPVLLWSAKPVLLEVASTGVDYLSLIIWGATAATAISAVAAAVHSPARRQVRAVVARPPVLRDAVVAGVFLFVWYYGYYRALSEANQVVVTIIAFTWPLVAVVVTPLINRSRTPASRSIRVWSLLGLGFAGAVVVGLGSMRGGESATAAGLWWAVAAAVGSGLYLPFAVRAMDRVPGDDSAVVSTFAVMSVANGAILLTALGVLLVTRQELHLPTTTAAWILCAGIGIGIYLAAEVLWSYVFSQEPALSAPLPYLVPVLSVVLTAVILETSVAWYSVVGMVLVVSSNIGIRLCRN